MIDCNFKSDCIILITFGTDIPDTTGHQITIQVSHLTQRLRVHYLRKIEQTKYALK